MSSQGQGHLRSFENKIVSDWISILKRAVGFHPNAYLTCFYSIYVMGNDLQFCWRGEVNCGAIVDCPVANLEFPAWGTGGTLPGGVLQFCAILIQGRGVCAQIGKAMQYNQL